MAIFEFVIEHFERWPEVSLLSRFSVDSANRSVLGFDGDDESFAVGQSAVADFSGEVLC